jgi:hypothetical protein
VPARERLEALNSFLVDQNVNERIISGMTSRDLLAEFTKPFPRPPLPPPSEKFELGR